MGARGGVGLGGGEPGPGVGPAAPLSVVPLFEIGAGGALRSRDGASPIGTGLSPGSGPERSASGGAAAAAGRAGKAPPGARGAAGGTRGRAGGGQPAAPPRLSQGRLSQGASVVDFLPGQRTSLSRLATHSASPGLRSSPRCCVSPTAGTCPAGAPPRPASRGTGVHLLTGQTLRSRRHGDRSGCPFHRLVEREHGMR